MEQPTAEPVAKCLTDSGCLNGRYRLALSATEWQLPECQVPPDDGARRGVLLAGEGKETKKRIRIQDPSGRYRLMRERVMEYALQDKEKRQRKQFEFKT